MLSKIFFASIAIILCSIANADYDVAPYCQIVPQDTKLASLDSCQNYYICQSNGQVLSAVCPNNMVFNKDVQGCVTAINGNCNKAIDNPCQNKNGEWVADTKVCNIWHYCKSGQITGSGSCGKGQVFNYASQRCMNGQCSQGEITNNCDIMPNGKFFGDFNDCTAWHKCVDNIEKIANCPNNLIYDVQTRTCVLSNGNTCSGPSEFCTQEIANKKLPDSLKCSNYFICSKQNNKWLWKKSFCPVGQYFNPATNTCLSRQMATPVGTCDRCEYSYNQWVNAVDPDCKTYLVCSNGVKTSSSACPHGTFDEQKQRCILGADLTQYRQINGACSATAAAS